jgi:hypothetical protein
MAEVLQTALQEQTDRHPADDPRVFELLVEAAVEMFAVIHAAQISDEGEDTDDVADLPTTGDELLPVARRSDGQAD